VATHRWPMIVFYVRHRGAQHTCAMVIQEPKAVWKETWSVTQALIHELGMAVVMPQLERGWLAIDTVLNRTAASPLTTSTGATASVAKCAMCVRVALATNRSKTTLTKRSRGAWSVADPLARNIVRQDSVVCKSCNNQRSWKLTLTIISQHYQIC